MSDPRHPNRPAQPFAPADPAARANSASSPESAPKAEAPVDVPETTEPIKPPAAQPGFETTTPEEGTPAFDEMDALIEEEPSVPDYASAYVPPRTLPKIVDHRTIDNLLVHISPEADPRRARTQKLQRIIDREKAQQLFGVADGAAQPPGPPSAGAAPGSAPFGPGSGAASTPRTASTAPLVGIVVVAIGSMALVIALVFAFVTFRRAPEPTVEAIPSPPPSTLAPAPSPTPSPAAAALPKPAATGTATASSPDPRATASAPPPAAQKSRVNKVGPSGPRPIIE